MCGILGVIATDRASKRSVRLLERAVRTGLRISVSRGKDASGLLALTHRGAVVAKAPVPGTRLLRGRAASSVLSQAKESAELGHHYVVLGHTRMMTSGDPSNPSNNQPVVRGALAALHNGIIVNASHIWGEIPQTPTAEVDTEAFLALAQQRGISCVDPLEALNQAFERLEGANTIATVDAVASLVHIATSNGSCHIFEDATLGVVFFASEPRVVRAMIARLGRRAGDGDIQQLKPGEPKVIRLMHQSRGGDVVEVPAVDRTLNEASGEARYQRATGPASEVERLLTVDWSAIAAIERCRSCVLPVTFPFLDLDEEGRCVLCRTAQPQALRPIEDLLAALEEQRDRGRSREVLVPISGGRDSSFALHYLVAELELPVIAYTYDWGFVTDRARRNVSRLCGSLGVEHVLVAADLRNKRANVRRNLQAWVRRPDLGMIPLFMAGDKHFFRYAGAIREERNLCGTIFSMNWYERTDFKAGFAGVDDRSRTGRTFEIQPSSRIRLAAYYTKQTLRNPAYLNRSVPDSVSGFAAFYLRRTDFHQLFDYIPWDEQTINKTIVDRYGWETAEDSSSTWRVGDATAAFYNFAYLSAVGFTEHDTFRSNQVRSGLLDRETALRLVTQENAPQVQEFATYCSTVGIEPAILIDAVRRLPRQY